MEVSDKLGNFGHGFTYSGHPVAAAVALRNIELMQEMDLFNHAARVGEIFQARLATYAEHPLVGNVRGRGLIGAIELAKPQGESFHPSQGVGAHCMNAALEAGLIVRALGETVAFCPPLIITDEQVDEIFTKFDRALESTSQFVATL